MCVAKSTLPDLNLAISIFFGSLLLSVQNNKPSIMFIPVTLYLFYLLKFKTLFVSTITGATLLVSGLYSAIASILLPHINQYILLFSLSATTPIHLAPAIPVELKLVVPSIF